MDEKKTVAQIAAEIGVSKQAIHKKMKCQPLSTTLTGFTSTVDNKVYVSNAGVSLIRQAFRHINGKTVDDNEASTTVNESSTVDALVDGEIVFLREQNSLLMKELEAERVYSREQAVRIADLADRLADLTRNSQVLLKQEQDRTPLLLTGKRVPLVKRIFGRK